MVPPKIHYLSTIQYILNEDITKDEIKIIEANRVYCDK